MQFKQTGKRKSRSNSHEQVDQRKRPARSGSGMEEESAPDDSESYQAKRRPRTRANLDEEPNAVMKMTMMTPLKFFGKQAPVQSKVLTCPSRQRFKTLLVVLIKSLA